GKGGRRSWRSESRGLPEADSRSSNCLERPKSTLYHCDACHSDRHPREETMKSMLTVSYAALVLGIAAGPALSAELPKSIAWTAYDVGSAGYSQAVSIGSALKNKSGVTLRVLPGKNDVSRLAPL